jgi:hypothetical protein
MIGIVPQLAAELLQQLLRLFQIACVEPLSEPAVNWSQKFARLLHALDTSLSMVENGSGSRRIIDFVVKSPAMQVNFRRLRRTWKPPFTRWPRAKALRPDVPVIMITTYEGAETKRKALENGAQAASDQAHRFCDAW